MYLYMLLMMVILIDTVTRVCDHCIHWLIDTCHAGSGNGACEAMGRVCGANRSAWDMWRIGGNGTCGVGQNKEEKERAFDEGSVHVARLASTD